MKKRIFISAALLFLSMPVTVNAFEPVSWPDDPVVALLGGSGSQGSTPLNSPFGGMTVAGGSYLDLGDALIQENHRVHNSAQAGAYSYDVPGTGWLGYQSQYESALMQTAWIDGVDHLSAVIIDQVNDCLHSFMCSEEDMDAYIQRAMDVAIAARDGGKCVVVMSLMPWENIDLPRVAALFGISYIISENDYRLMADKHRAAFESLDGINYVDAYEGMTTYDGIHWDSGSAKKGAHRVSKVLRKKCGF
ncbi:MAG: hypothetical protein OEV42_04050 [Deltaproteobacteria bacterium]|nr:hypothetical protein [Deltaproteobacteria bacterium]